MSPTTAGDSALYISDGSAGTGCTVSYVYQNSPSGSQFSLAYTSIDATCASALNFSYDYKSGGIASEDYTELVYSTDGGTIWNVIGSPLTINAAWSNVSVSLSTHLGFLFIFDRFSFYLSTICLSQDFLQPLTILP